MSTPAATDLLTPVSADAPAPATAPAPSPIVWADPARHDAFNRWLDRVATAHALAPASLRSASADASFRRYFRIDLANGGTKGAVNGAASRIIMDAPPAQENCAPFVQVAGLMATAGLNVPQVLDWDQAQGFMLLTDLGARTLMEVIDPQQPQANLPLYSQALDALLAWQLASRPGVLPPYNAALLRRELNLFPDWYLARHRGVTLSGADAQTVNAAFDLIVQRNLAAPSVYVHRDFMPRNLMQPDPSQRPGTAAAGLGVLDFQDAVYGPASYDIASLMRDAFLSWDEAFVIDITIRYWEKARRAGLLDFEDWHSDFGAFYRAVEWMGLQRHLKVAGIFARLTLRDGKPRYLADTPRFITYIRATTHRYRELGPLLKLLDQIEGTEVATGYAFGRV